MTYAEERELEWWQDFATKILPDSIMPRVGSQLLGYRFRVIAEDDE